MIFMFLILLVNLVISFLNARSCGRMWAESKAIGGWIHVLTWCGAIQSAIGFTTVWSFFIGTVAYLVGYLNSSMISFYSSFLYVLIILPAIGTGILITIESWIQFFREKSLLNLGTAGWNSFAEIYNIYHAVNSFGDAFSIVKDGFSELFDSDSDNDASPILLVILLAVFSLFAGIMTTYWIVQRYAASLPMPEAPNQLSKI